MLYIIHVYISVSYTHLDVYKRQHEVYTTIFKCFTLICLYRNIVYKQCEKLMQQTILDIMETNEIKRIFSYHMYRLSPLLEILGKFYK